METSIDYDIVFRDDAQLHEDLQSMVTTATYLLD